jgi:cell division protein FtsB
MHDSSSGAKQKVSSDEAHVQGISSAQEQKSSLMRKKMSRILPGISKKIRVRFFLALAVLVPIAGYVLFARKGIVPRIGLVFDKKDLQAKIIRDKYQQDSLLLLLKRLEQDTFFIEKIARERYGMAKPGEKVFILEQSP